VPAQARKKLALRLVGEVAGDTHRVAGVGAGQVEDGRPVARVVEVGLDDHSRIAMHTLSGESTYSPNAGTRTNPARS